MNDERPAGHAAVRRTSLSILGVLMLAVVLGSGCGSSSDAETTDLLGRQRHGGEYGGRRATGDTPAGAEFARWVLDQDPRREYITDAVVRGERALGIKVQSSMRRNEVQRLLVALAEGMSQAFPGRPLQVIAFEQDGDRLGQADYNPRTGRVDVRLQ